MKKHHIISSKGTVNIITFEIFVKLQTDSTHPGLINSIKIKIGMHPIALKIPVAKESIIKSFLFICFFNILK